MSPQWKTFAKPGPVMKAESSDPGRIPKVLTEPTWRDTANRWKMRWGIGRMRGIVKPGLYRVGDPDRNARVFVTANYRMTFDLLRSALSGMDAYILVLDTKGINVWCAAGKGTFGTDELVRRLAAARLDEIVDHQTLIVPQLGGPGVSGHEVRRRSGFKVVFGPVRTNDIRRFLDGGMKATPDMRKMRFGMKDRLVMVPMELVPALKLVPVILGATVLFALLRGGDWIYSAWMESLPYLGAIFMGSVLFQILLPWLPTRSFGIKAGFLGVLWAVASTGLFGIEGWDQVAVWLVVPALVAFLGLNFTGATTYTSLSGVKKELRIAIPAMIGCLAVGLIFKIISVV